MVAYTKTTGTIINVITSCCAIIFIFLSVFQMPQRRGKEETKPFYMQFFVIIICQLGTVLVAASLTILIAVIVDALSITQSWYSETWLIFGLYFCPMFFILAIGPGLYIHWTKNKVRNSDTALSSLTTKQLNVVNTYRSIYVRINFITHATSENFICNS